jgi:hypothetical protein
MVRDDGNVGIGTASPTYKLDVNGSGRFTAATANSTGLYVSSTVSGNTGDFSVTPRATPVGTAGDFSCGVNAGARLYLTGYEVIGPRMTLTGNLTAAAGAFTSLSVAGTSIAFMDQSNSVQKAMYLTGFASTSKTAIILDPIGSFSRDNFHICLNNVFDATPVTINDAKLSILNSGNIGIGTRTPTDLIDINGANGYSQLRLRAAYTPTGTADTNGNTGDISWDANYIYVKTAAGWKRSALTTW